MPGRFLTAAVTVCELCPQRRCEGKMFTVCLHSEKTFRACRKSLLAIFSPLLSLPKVQRGTYFAASYLWPDRSATDSLRLTAPTPGDETDFCLRKSSAGSSRRQKHLENSMEKVLSCSSECQHLGFLSHLSPVRFLLPTWTTLTLSIPEMSSAPMAGWVYAALCGPLCFYSLSLSSPQSVSSIHLASPAFKKLS